MEIRKNIEWYEWQYQVSNTWKVRSMKFWKVKELKQKIDHRWYYIVQLCMHSKHKDEKVHRLVAKAFITVIEWRNEINHKDWNKLNNNVENLERCTRKENVQHQFKTWLTVIPKWWKNWWSKKVQCLKEWKLIRVFDCIADVQRERWLKVPNVIRACQKHYNCWWYQREYVR